jgi:MFS superfamily sulfate permease-like transporter
MFLTLLIGAMTVGSLHALAPDHWVPFAAVARGRSWSAGRTARVTFLCGFSHASVSALLGLVALFVGLEVMQSFGSSMGSVGTPSAVVVVVAYEAATLPTMVALVLLARAAATRLRWHFLEHYADGAAGALIAVLGGVLLVLGMQTDRPRVSRNPWLDLTTPHPRYQEVTETIR